MQKTIEKIVSTKLAEHVSETDAVQQKLEEITKKLQEKRDVEMAQKFMILKDKMIFHKACSMVLQDVLDEAEKYKEEKDEI